MAISVGRLSEPDPKIDPEYALKALVPFIEGQREVFFAGYPALPEGLHWSADVSGLLLVSDPDEENLFLDVLLKYTEQFDKMGNLFQLNKLVTDQLGLLEALVTHYQILQSLTAAYAWEDQVEEEQA